MKFLVTSTGGHQEYSEDFNGTVDEFIRFKFGSFHNMRDTGRDVIEVIPTETVVETVTEPVVKPTKKKKASDEA